MDYLSFYHLDEDPFRLTPDPHFFFPTPDHNDALFSLDYAVEQKEGFSLILGGPGTGKTTILRVFIAKWKDKADIALVMTPRLTPEEFLQAVLEDLNVHVCTGNKNELIKAFRDMLVERSVSGRRVIIIVDEAQSLPTETLEELRLLSNLETEKEKLLQIMLVGQPELAKKLSSDELEQLNQRIAVKAALKPLDSEETREYINYRLIKAGRGSVVFHADSVKLIHTLSKGIPRLINLFASRSLMAAYVEGSYAVARNHVGHANANLSPGGGKRGGWLKSLARRVPRGLAPYALAGAILVIAISIVFARVNVHEKMISPGNGQATPSEKTSASNSHGAAVAVKQESGSPRKPITGTTIVFSGNANLREGPSAEAGVLTWAKQGAVFEVIGEETEETGTKWFRVRMKDGADGWVSAKMVKPAGSTS